MHRKLLSMIMGAALLCGCSEDRMSYLKVYNWGDYIDEDLIPEFEAWYKEQTGEDVKVIYQTFDINETMLSKIEKGHEDYDLVCPSDYIIERMLREDLLLPLDFDFGNTPNYIGDNLSPFIRDCFDKIDGGGRNANDYAVGYMWGTTGILYNTKYVSEEDASTWNILHNRKYADKLFVKDAPRDVYCPVLIYLRQDELKSGKVTLDSLMYDLSDESLAEVEAYMKETRELVAGWEADFGKEQMTQERGWANLTWSGDAVWAIEEAGDVGVELKYIVPEEGSNVWFDGWVIPKYACNVKAASYFINFLCIPEVAIRNMDFIGYVSTNGSSTVLESIEDEDYPAQDLSYFFGPDAVSVCSNPSVYPDKSVIARCAMMHDSGERSALLLQMWARVKGENATPFTYVVIAVTAVFLIALEVRKKMIMIRRRKRRQSRKARRR